MAGCAGTSPSPLNEDAATAPLLDAGADATVDAGADTPLDAGRDAGPVVVADAATPGATRLIGTTGIARWDALAASEKARVGEFRSAFLHKSVGQDLEDGLNANGIATDYITGASTLTASGVSGGLFDTNNGDGVGKIAEWQAFAVRNGSSRLRVAIMKFGYADVSGDLQPLKAAYANAVNAIHAGGMRVLHVTPPLVFDDAPENAFKMQMRAWMLATFPNDVTFDLMDVESTNPANGARCERGGAWEICDNVRSTAACSSLAQGVDAPSGQGHLCSTQGTRIAKAFLDAIYEAGR